MPNPWFRFYGGEFLNDEKIIALDGNERSIWLTLLCLASQKSGVVRFVSEARLIELSGIKQKARYAGVLDKFQMQGMVKVSNGDVTVCNWAKRQYSEGYSRVLAFRETQKKRKSNANVTPYTESDTDTEKRLRKEQAREFNQSLFQGLKDGGVEIQDAAGERTKYPSLFRRKNPDVNYWIGVAKYSQIFNFKPGEGKDYIFPWKGPVKLSKLYYEVREKFDVQGKVKDGLKTYQNLKAEIFKSIPKPK